MGFIKRALVQEVNGELKIRFRSVSKYAPLNRVLDEVGFYAFEGIEIKDQKYILVYDPEEKYVKKTKCLFSKVSAEGIVDVLECDFEDILEKSKELMNYKESVVN